MFRYVVCFAVLYVLGWIAYLELSPTLGNIWWRRNAEGLKEFCPWGIWATAIAPFRHAAFWHPSFWDMNPWPVLVILAAFCTTGTTTPDIFRPSNA